MVNLDAGGKRQQRDYFVFEGFTELGVDQLGKYQMVFVCMQADKFFPRVLERDRLVIQHVLESLGCHE
jgi:hypothetical protein